MTLRAYLWGPASRLGAGIAAVALVLDQASKIYLLDVFNLAERGAVALTPFLALVLAWNTGISYSLFPQEGAFGQAVLLAFKLIAVICLWVWLARADGRVTAAALGLIIGGAAGNAIDGVRFQAVMDFVYVHITTPTFRFSWYVFNLADVAIVVGVGLLLYDTFFGTDPSVEGPLPKISPDRADKMP